LHDARRIKFINFAINKNIIMKHKKYEFTNEEKWNEVKINLPHEIIEESENNEICFNGTECISILGNLVTTEAEFDDEGNITKNPEFSTTWHVDILYINAEDEPEALKEFVIELNNIGIHGFAGVDYLNQ
jgi:hypothetical protein